MEAVQASAGSHLFPLNSSPHLRRFPRLVSWIATIRDALNSRFNRHGYAWGITVCAVLSLSHPRQVSIHLCVFFLSLTRSFRPFTTSPLSMRCWCTRTVTGGRPPERVRARVARSFVIIFVVFPVSLSPPSFSSPSSAAAAAFHRPGLRCQSLNPFLSFLFLFLPFSVG